MSAGFDFGKLKHEVARQVKEQLDALGAELTNEVEPLLWKLEDDIITFAAKYARGEDVSMDLVHLQSRAKMLAAVIFTKAQNKFVETLVTIAETAARILGAAAKAAI